MPNPVIQHFYHEQSGTLSYVVSDPETSTAAVVDPVLGFTAASGRTSHSQLDEICRFLEQRGLKLEWILETHAHADHLSGAQILKSRLGGVVAIGQGICGVQEHFAALFNLRAPFRSDGSQFDRLFVAGDRFSLGAMEGRVFGTPGHTGDSISYVIGNSVFVGDTLFMPDFGTARCDFPGGDAGALYDSIQALLSLPDETLLYMCHDYRPGGRELRYSVSVGEQRETNIHVGGDITRSEFVAMRNARDRTLSLPELILPALQVNIRAGHVPEAEDNAISYLKIPLDHL